MSDPSNKARVEESIRARGPDYQRLVEHRCELERVRKREARKRQMPEQRENERARKREARLRQTSEQREREKQREATRCRRKERPFITCDKAIAGDLIALRVSVSARIQKMLFMSVPQLPPKIPAL
jgi:hypothetical protein